MRRFVSVMVVCVLALSPAGCGNDNGGTDPGDVTPPEVVSSNPQTGATDLGLLQQFEVTFSESMDPATLNDETVSISTRGSGLHIKYDDAESSLWAAPESLHTPEANLRFTIDGATDLAGNEITPFSIDFATGPFDCEHLADRFEPNEDVASAVHVGLDTLITSLSTCSDDIDVYSFTLEEESMVTVRTYITHDEVDPEEERDNVSWAIHLLYDEGMTLSTLGTSAVTGWHAAYHYSYLPGTYYAKIFGHNDEVDVIYDLYLETGTACEDDEYEDNDFREHAALIEPGTHMMKGCHVDSDWYKLPVEAGQTISATLNGQDAEGTRFIRLYGPGSEYYGSETNDDNPMSGQILITEDGDALIRTQFWSDDVDYELTLEVVD